MKLVKFFILKLELPSTSVMAKKEKSRIHYFVCSYPEIVPLRASIACDGVFPKWNRNSLNSANSGNLINH